ncbi:regulatory protein, luxR family [Nocardioides terrae]|uniref:Regulatory protein, luxR family n=1 Tax=Nocardioides terrae TaxID=574651 RepID=A0A1I1LZG3_9ACTN|nr:LuxR family transcriptional regulator [Nocardioides terrae]SFC76338.1 regulatory protein, luxR family [Nocardioides terrae]
MKQRPRPSAALLGRRRECAALDELIQSVEGGLSASLLLHGEAGIGKSALLEYAAQRATGFRVARVAGIESEADLAFGGVHQLCGSFLDHLTELPAPQRDALETAFALRSGSAPDRFLVGLATLSLLADVAAERPLLCLVDDAQWLDRISAQTLAFVGRRLSAEGVLLLTALRDDAPEHPLRALPQLEVSGLADHDARALLTRSAPGRVDPRIRERVLAEARGNPLALLELPRTTAFIAGSAHATSVSVGNHLEEEFRRRVQALSPETQRLLLLAAAEQAGDVSLLRRAAEALHLHVEVAAAEAEASDLFTMRSMARFRHPLVRSAAYGSAPPSEQRQVHRALAEAIDPHIDPDRRAWHLANATAVAKERIAADLVDVSTRAMARGGLAAAAAFLDRAAELTPDPARRGARTLRAATLEAQAGEFSRAIELLDSARLHPLTERDEAQADLVRGQVLAASRSASAGLPLLLSAAKRLEALDPWSAKQTYRDALYAAMTAGSVPQEAGTAEHVAAAILSVRPQQDPTRDDLLLEGAARLVAGDAGGLHPLQQALAGYQGDELPPDEALGWLPLACRMAHDAWEFDTWSALSARLVELARVSGALAVLPSAFLLRLSNRVFAGDLATGEALLAQAAALADVAGGSVAANYGALVLAPWQGREERTAAIIQRINADSLLEDEGKVVTATQWAAAVLANGSGRHEEALTAGRAGAAHPAEMGLATWSMVEVAEAAARLGRPDEAGDAVRHLRSRALASGSDWARGTAAYVSALVTSGQDAEADYLEAMERLDRAGVGALAARAHLVYGEWLLDSGRIGEGRERLTHAHELLDRMGVAAFAERALTALGTSGVPVERRPSAASSPLTPQELHIAELAAAGMTNPEIGAELFLSAHTVEWHLRKVFTKLGIRSRREIGPQLSS